MKNPCQCEVLTFDEAFAELMKEAPCQASTPVRTPACSVAQDKHDDVSRPSDLRYTGLTKRYLVSDDPGMIPRPGDAFVIPRGVLIECYSADYEAELPDGTRVPAEPHPEANTWLEPGTYVVLSVVGRGHMAANGQACVTHVTTLLGDRGFTRLFTWPEQYGRDE